jgi:parallel beta-helix repeat protein
VVKINQTPVLFLRTLKRHALRVFVVLALFLLIAPVYTYTRGYLRPVHVSAATGINHQISFQGKLVNPDGTNVTDGSYSIVFSIYTVASAGSNIWTETQSVTLSNGIFQVNLGSVTTLPGSIDFNTDNIYLGIKVGADAEMTPRVQFTAVPQAFNAEKLGGLDKTGFVQNTTSLQSNANLYIQSGAIGNVTAKLRAFAGQTADILQVRDSGDTTTVFAISPAGTITAGTWNGTAVTDTYVSDTLTIGSAGTVDWQALNNYPAACSAGNAISALGDTPTCSPFLTAEADTLTSVTGRGASTATATTFSGGSTIRGVTVDSATGTQDRILVSIAAVGAARFDGTITNADLTATRTWTFQDNSGVVALGTAANSLFFTTTGATNVTLPTSGTLCSTATCLTAEADTLASVTGRGATTATASTFTGGATIRGVTVDTATATQDRIAVSAAAVGAARFDGTITNNDLTAARTWTLQDNSGVVALGTAANSLFFTTTGATNVTLPTSGTLCSTATCVTAEADTLASVTGRGASTATATIFSGGSTIRGVTVDSATGTNDKIALSVTTIGAASFTGTITNADLSVARTWTLPDEDGTFCFRNSVNCGFLTGAASNYIQNQNAGQQATSNFWISSTGRADVSFTAPLFDTPTAAVLNIGTTNASQISLNKNVVVAASQYLTITGSGTRPSSPTAGMLYYDTATNQLIQWNGTKWVSDRSPATKIIAPSNASQTAKDSADVVLTGTADQTLINTALTAAAGGRVYIMEGTVTITGSISVPNNTTLAGAGAGTLITIPNAFNGTINAVTNTTAGGSGTGITIQDLSLDGNKSNQTAGFMRGIYLIGVGSGTGSGAIQGARVSNVRVSNWYSTRAGIWLDTSSNNIFSNTTSQGNNGEGFYVVSSSNNQFVNNVSQGNALTGFNINSGTSNTFTGNSAQGNTTTGFYVDGTYSTYTGNTSQSNAEGFHLNSGNNTISGNTVQNNSSYGIYVSSSGSAITGNTIIDSGGATTNNAIYLNSASSNTITGNTISDASASTNNYAINVFNVGSSTNYLSNNTLGTGSINDAGTGTIYANQADASGNLINKSQGGSFNVRGNSTTAFQIQNAAGTSTLLAADTTNSTIKVQSSSYAIQSANLFTGTYSFPATAGWTAISGTGSTATATHTAGGGLTPLSPTPAMTITAGATYQIVFRITGSPTAGQTITPGIGGVPGRAIEGDYSGETQTITATTTGNLTFTPTNNWNGIISQVFVYQITTANAAIQVLDHLGNPQLEVRSGAAGAFNSYIGYLSGQNDVNSNSNVAVGAYSLQANTFGSSNTAVGYYALNSNNSYYNVAVGDHALYSNTDGLQNIGIGYRSLYTNTTGSDNIGIGYLAQNNLTNGNNNVSLGDNTLGGISNANGNVAIGQSALNTITGSFNTALGYQAGWHDSGGVWSTNATIQNSTAIGAYAQVQASNSIVLGSVDTATKVGVGITVPSNTFSVSPLDYQTGTATRTNSSATLVGTGTTWTSAMVGDIIVFADGTTNTVTGFTDATHVTMGTTYAGTTDASPVKYRFHHYGLQVTSSGNTSVQSLTVVGGITSTRPSSPTPGMLYYDTTTNQLLQWNGTKWVSDRSPATKIIAPSNASQTAKDSADVVLTGTADQTLINTALTAAAGGRVYIMEGQVNVTGSISVPNNTTLAGAGRGTLITIPNSTNLAINMITNTTTGGSGTGVVIQDMQLDGNRPNNLTATTYGVYLNGIGSTTTTQGAKVNGMWINNFHGGAVFLTSSSNTIVTNNTTINNYDRGFSITSGSNNVITNNISQTTPYGYYLDTATNNTISGNAASGSVNDGFRLTTNSNNNTVSGNTSDGASANNYIVTGTSNNNTFTGNTSSNGATDGFAVFSNYNTFTGNTSFSDNSALFDIGASFNTFTGNTLRGDSTSFYGFQLNSANSNTISNNTIIDTGGNTTNNAISISTSDSNNITGNTITDTTHTTNNFAIDITNSSSDTNYLSNNTLGGASINDLGTGTIYGGQLDSGGNYTVQPAGIIELQAPTQVKPTTTSSTAFQVLNTAGNSPITVSTAADSLNLITNPGFEINTTGWALRAAGSIARSTAQHYFGQASLGVTTTTTNDGVKYPIVLAINTQYSFYFDVYAAAPITGLSFGYSSDGSTEATYVTSTNLATGWNHVYMNFTTPATVNAGAYFFAKQTDATARTFYIDDVEADTKVFGSPSNIVSGGYVENVVSIGGNNSVATSLGINTTSPVGALEVDQKFGQMGFVLKGAGLNTLSEPLAFSIWNGDNTLAVSYAEVLRTTTVRGGSAFWNSAALQVNTIQTGAVGLRVTGMAAQTADLIQARDSTNKNVFSVGTAGDTKIGKGGIQPTTVGSVKSTSSGTFATKVDYQEGSASWTVASNDFNRDGYLDFAIVNATSGTVSVFINNGNGTFATKVDYPTATSPRGIISADFNGDGKPDIAVTNNGSVSMSVFINNGNGTFATKVDYPTGNNPTSVTAADFNGDGKPDLAVANTGSDTISIFINSGTGTFAAKVDYSSPTSPTGITSADFNGDGKPDLAVVNNFTNNTSVFLNSGLGSGQFGASPPTATSKTDYTTGTGPRYITSADFNGDGKPDMAVTNNTSGTVSIFINSGNGLFAAKVDYTTGTNPVGITSADFNGDGKPDIAVANSGTTNTSVFLNSGLGSGQFGASPPTATSKTDYPTGAAPLGITSADFNNDGFPDLVAAGNGAALASVFLNNVSSGFDSSTTTQLSAKTAIINDSGKVGLLVQGASTSDNIFQAQNSTGQLLSSIDGSGRLTVGGGPVYVAQLSVDGQLSFATKVDTTTGLGPTETATADFNSDGKPDVAVVNFNASTMSVFLNSGTGTFPSAVATPATATGPTSVTSGDFNGDGKPDLAVTNQTSGSISVFLNSGTSPYFSAKTDTTTASLPQNIVSADFNGDGKPDLAVTNNGTTSLSVFLNSGTGTFPTKTDYNTTGSPYGITTADFNGDGNIDIAITRSSNTMSILLNNGSGAFTTIADYATATAPRLITSADFNNDGYPDVAVENSTSASASVFLNNKDGTFATKVDYPTGSTSFGITAADFSGDGKPDLAATSQGSNTLSILINNGTGTFATKIDYTTANSPQGLSAADFNGDGRTDITVPNGNANSMSIFMNTSSPSVVPVSKGTLSVTTADSSSGGLYIQGVANQTADYLNIQNSSGSEIASINNAGTLTLAGSLNVAGGANITGNTTMAGTLTVGGVTPTPTIVQSGKVNINMGTLASTLGSVSSVGEASWFDAGTNTIAYLQTYGYRSSAGSDATTAAFAIRRVNDGTALGILAFGGNGNTCIGAYTCTHGFGVSGTIGASGTITASTTPDLAETIPAAPDVEAADVVMADPDNTERVIKSNGAYNGAAVGVISDGTSSFMINSHANSEDGPLTGAPLVLAGRVPVKVTNEGGEIKPGDYLTTSSTPGKAMKATHAGPTIGKALGFFDGTEESGTVLALINVSYYEPPMGDVLQGAELHISGDANIGGDFSVAGQLNVSGAATLASLTVTGDATVQGNLTVAGDVEVRNITVNGHIITSGNAPVVAIGDAVGQAAANEAAPIAAVDGNDSAGTINVTTGSQNLANGVLAHISFAEAFSSSYKVVLSASNDPAGTLRVHTVKTATGFDIVANDTVSGLTQYAFDYIVLGSQTTK